MTDQDTKDFTGLSDTPEHLMFDEASLHAYLLENVDGYAGPLSVQKFKGGQSNPTYLLETPGQKYVLRRKPPGKLLPSAHAVDREYKVMTALHDTGFPAPKTYALCEDDAIIGTAFYVMDFVEGRIFWDSTLNDVAREQRRPIYEAAVDTLALLHTTDYKKAGLQDFGKEGSYFERQIGRWSKQYQNSATDDIKAMNDLISFLPTAVPASDQTSIVHGDFRLDNMIVHPSEPRALAVLDWELSTLGHPMADFTYYLMTWNFPPGMRGGLAGQDLDQLNIPTLDEVVERYCAKTGQESLPNLDYCLAYNMFRLAAIIQGVYARALQGNASSEKGISLGKTVEPLAQLAWSHAKKAGA